MKVEQVRIWLSRHIQALGLVAIAFALYGQATQQFWRMGIGLALISVLSWGRLVRYPAPGQSWHRPFFIVLMWWCIAFAVGCVAMSVWLHLHPEG